MSTVRLLIVEDEPFIAQDLALRLERMGFVVTDIVDTGAAALHAVRRDRPDLVLLDINIKGEWDGIQTAERLGAQQPFIFLTALADDATLDRAKRTRPAAYLLKPLNDRRIQIAIELALFDAQAHEIPPVAPVLGMRSDSVFLKHGGQYHKLVLSELRWMQAEGNYTTVHTATGKLVLTIAIGALLRKLDYPDLIRTHRSYAVNVRHITRYEDYRLFVGEAEVAISRAHREAVRQRLHLL